MSLYAKDEDKERTKTQKRPWYQPVVKSGGSHTFVLESFDFLEEFNVQAFAAYSTKAAER